MDSKQRAKCRASISSGDLASLQDTLAGLNVGMSGSRAVDGGHWSDQEDEDETLLMAAIRHGNAMALEVLLESGADLDERTPSRGDCAFCWCAKWGDLEMMKALARRCVAFDPNRRNWEGSSLALLATFYGDARMLDWLLKKGADPEIAGEDGMDCHDAALSGCNDRSDCSALLATHKAKSAGTHKSARPK